MAQPVIIGNSPIKQPDRLVYDKRNGNGFQSSWLGSREQIYSLAALLRNQYERVEIEDRGSGVFEALATTSEPYGGEVEAPTVNLEVVGVELIEDIANSPYFANQLSDADLCAARKVLDATECVADLSNPSTILQEYIDMKARGIEGWKIFTTRVTRTINVSRFYSGFVNFTNLGKLWTQTQLSNYVGSPVTFNIPNRTASAAQQAKSLQYRWMQDEAASNLTNRGGFTLTESWLLALFDTRLYDAAT